jgi:hypothetical protein
MAKVDKITGRKVKKKLPRARARTGLAGVPMTSWTACQTYFHMEVDRKDFAKVLKDWVKKNYSKPDAKAILANPEWNFTAFSYIPAAITWIDAGNSFLDMDPKEHGYQNCAKKKMDPLIETGKQILKEKAVADKEKSNVIVLTPQQKLWRKTNSTIMYDLQDLEDQWIEGEETTLDVYSQFRLHGLTAASIDMPKTQIEGWLLDYSDAYHKRCEQAVEGYSHIARKELKRRIKVCEDMLLDLEKVKASKKATRKSRAPKVKTADKQVAKMQYLKESSEFKLTSILVTSVPGAMRLYTFNVKNKEFIELISSSTNGFEVSGSTIKNVDLEGSRKVKLRKPDEFLPTALSGTAKQVDNAWSKLTTKTGTPNARINKDTVLLKVSIK